ncbi:MAG TPA: bifunctional diguanylate cyclase/phosphodiesterase [Thiomicrospira sp.]|nr:bifunctional diguanylate cyclase/phosphodiesterase [Thiomicrospira sp.]
MLSLAFIFTVSGASKNQDDAIQVAKNIQSELTHVRLGITQNIHPDSRFQPFPVDEIRHYFQQAEQDLAALNNFAYSYYLFTQQPKLQQDVAWLQEQVLHLRTDIEQDLISSNAASVQTLPIDEVDKTFVEIHHRLTQIENSLVSGLASANQTFIYGLFLLSVLVITLGSIYTVWFIRSRKQQQAYTTLLEDVNQLVRQKNQLLLVANERSQNYLDVAAVIILVLDVDGNINMINHKGCQVLGYDEADLIGKNWFDLCVPNESSGALKELYDGIIYHHQPVLEHLESEVLDRMGSTRMISWKNVLLKDEQGQVTGMISSGEDVTEIKKTEDQLAFLAHHDNLTGLPNRSLLNARLQHALQIAHRQPTLLAVCFFDIDNFKNINDSYGHDVGDELLITVSKRIQEIIRKNDTLARLGGDEFVLVLENLRDKTEVAVIIEKILVSFSQPMTIEDHTLSVTTSIGISLYPQDGLDVNSLIKFADTAMYQAKGDGKNTYAFYAEHMTEELMQRVYIQNDLKEALAENQFEVFYQPQVDLVTNKPIGLEALVRWNHPEKGLVMPSEFIQFAEESNSIQEIGYQVLRQACLDIKELHDEKLFSGYVAVNVSAIQLKDHNFISTLVDLIEETGIQPQWLELELTESVVMNETKEGIAMLSSLSKLGVKIAIDDFGTGYSSLSYLSELPFDKLKIDMSFIRNVLSDEKARTVAEAIIQLSNSMNMTTLAEGIEQKAQKEYLKICKCEQGQGFLFSKPKPLRKLKRWLKKVA